MKVPYNSNTQDHRFADSLTLRSMLTKIYQLKCKIFKKTLLGKGNIILTYYIMYIYKPFLCSILYDFTKTNVTFNEYRILLALGQ